MKYIDDSKLIKLLMLNFKKFPWINFNILYSNFLNKNIPSPRIRLLNDIISWLVALPSPSESEPRVSYSEIGRCRVNIFFTSESVLPRLSDSEIFVIFITTLSKSKCIKSYILSSSASNTNYSSTVYFSNIKAILYNFMKNE